MRKLGVITAAAALAVVLGFAGTALADITIDKEIVEITVFGEDPITDSQEIEDFLNEVPNTTVITFTVEITVGATNEQDLTDIVVTDRFGSELDATCVSVTGDGGSDCDDVTISTTPGNDKLRWLVGNLDDGESATLTVDAVTNEDPDGNQRYTSCGLHEFNSGATAKGRLDRGTNPAGKSLGKKQVSADFDPGIMLVVSGFIEDGKGQDFPECSNCFDDDDDGDTDFPDDQACTDALDDDEENGD